MRKISSASDTKEISLTIYNGGFGAVKEQRHVGLTGHETELVFADVAQQIETDSLMVEGLNVLEFNYDYDLVNKGKLLQKYIDKEVYLVDRKTGEKKSCRLLSVEGTDNCVLEDILSKEIYLDTKSEMVLPSLPSGLIVKPALVWKIAPTAVEKVKVSYLSKGFNWKANYVIEVLENTLNLAGWAEIENQSGTTFENAKVKLIAGDVNRIDEADDWDRQEIMLCDSLSMSNGHAEEKSFFDYHMYTLLNPTTLKENQTKQINLLNGKGVPYRRYYRLDIREDKVKVIIEFANKKECGLGIALPKGKLKLYKVDEVDNSLEFIGEDNIDHTPKDEDIKLTIGNAFDITFEFTEIERKKIIGFEHFRYECIIKNHKENAAEVNFDHYVWGVWDMVTTSHEYTKKNSGFIEFIIPVPADGEVTVCFEYKVDRRTEVVVKKN